MSKYYMSNGTFRAVPEHSDELRHYGVPGMKWGVRRYQNKDGGLTSAGKKRYGEGRPSKLDRDRAKAAKKLERAKTKRGREKAQADVDRLAKAKPESYAKAHSVSARVNTAMTKIGALYLGDQIFNDGRGTRAAIQAVKGIGMATITAYTMARGGYDIKWYDKYGRRIG